MLVEAVIRVPLSDITYYGYCGYYYSKLEYISPLGKSDHAIIKWECEVTTLPKMQPVNYNYLTGNYDEMRMFLSRDWDKILLPVSNSVDEMWSAL